MKKFLVKVMIMFLLVVLSLGVALLYLHDQAFNDSVLGAIPDKNQMLANAPSPKIIIIGGSSASFGFNSEKLAQAYHMPVINTGISRLLGLKFMVDNVKPYIKKGDIVIFAAEYHCFNSPDDFYGEQGLVSALFDIYPEGKKYIDVPQWIHLTPYLGMYALAKIKGYLYEIGKVYSNKGLYNIYGRKSFNQYGDAWMHWKLPRDPFPNEAADTGAILPAVMPYLNQFKNYVAAQKATLVAVPCAYQDTSYNNNSALINKVEATLKRNNFPLIAEPIRYRFPDKYFFNTVYHLTKQGTDLRTEMVIQDLSKVISPK